MKKVLFICKVGHSYSGFDRKFSGLFNSTKFISDSIGSDPHITSKVVQVKDNNCIDREVHQFKPDIVIIEALWVVPQKFEILKALHPKVKWFIHLHSDVPFLSMEGIAIEWIKELKWSGVGIIVNSKEAQVALKPIFGDTHLLENCYPIHNRKQEPRNSHYVFIDIGCFGAIRPMKNQLMQAMAAIRFAEKKGRLLRFHINHSRVEGGENILKNLRALFANSVHQLIEHDWHNHHEFLRTIRGMHVSMQVSYSETFNIITADAVSSGVPVVVSKEIEWVNIFNKVDCDSIEDIIWGLNFAFGRRWLVKLNQWRLRNYSAAARYNWIRFINAKTRS